MKSADTTHRILLIDDNPAIHEDFRKILTPGCGTDNEFADVKAAFFDLGPQSTPECAFEIDSAFQGQEGLGKIQSALQEGRPYAMAFVDVRMPPGWDGVETIKHVWEQYPELQVVICTAYSDYSWNEIVKTLGQSDSLLILKKPFDNVEVLQLAHALTKKWTLTQEAKHRMEDLDRIVLERTQALRASEERFAKAFYSNPLPMAIQTMADQKFIDLNESFVRLSGHAREAVLNHTPSELGLWPDAEALIKLVNEKKSVRECQSSFRDSSGETRETLLFAEQFDLNGHPCLLMLIQDVSERLNLESQLRQAQKMQAIGQLAAGIAHDFNNMLTIVQGHLGLVLPGKNIDPRQTHSLRQALAASERASNLTRQLLAFSRKQVMERKPVKVAKLFDQIGGMLQRVMGEQIHMQIHCPPEVPPMHADTSNIEQVILNLVVNARDAMPQGGRLAISASRAKVLPEQAASNPDASSGEFVCLSVSDTGSGMDAATLSHIFEPFFTTKDVGKGTGMGLATVYGIVKQHKGWVEVESQVGAGTTFRIYLPISADNSDTAHVPRPAVRPVACKDNETILLVEDENSVREVVQNVLETHGYRVLAATNAPEALKLWEQHSASISLLLADVVMPGGLSGKELAEQIRLQKPGLKLILTSGYGLEVLGDNVGLDSEYFLLQKPYQTEVLARTIRQCLDGSAVRGTLVNGAWATPSVSE